MRKFIGLVVGGVAMAVIYLLGTLYCDHLVKSTGHSPESYLWLAFLIFAPLACFVGGGVSGAIAAPVSTKLRDALWFSPGVYVGVPGLVPAFLEATLDFALSMILPVLLWAAASAGGFLLMRAVRRRRASWA